MSFIHQEQAFSKLCWRGVEPYSQRTRNNRHDFPCHCPANEGVYSPSMTCRDQITRSIAAFVNSKVLTDSNTLLSSSRDNLNRTSTMFLYEVANCRYETVPFVATASQHRHDMCHTGWPKWGEWQAMGDGDGHRRRVKRPGPGPRWGGERYPSTPTPIILIHHHELHQILILAFCCTVASGQLRRRHLELQKTGFSCHSVHTQSANMRPIQLMIISDSRSFLRRAAAYENRIRRR